jgi:NADPH-dependent 2,4-dienoyl-CoA reductase/sulfur reductase-like enzyme
MTTNTLQYDLLHVGAPCSAPEVLRKTGDQFVDANGFLDVDQTTMQHKHYTNVFGIGDCCNSPNAKTAAAVCKLSNM